MRFPQYVKAYPGEIHPRAKQGDKYPREITLEAPVREKQSPAKPRADRSKPDCRCLVSVRQNKFAVCRAQLAMRRHPPTVCDIVRWISRAGKPNYHGLWKTLRPKRVRPADIWRYYHHLYHAHAA